jgi:hypothetical protein
MIYAVGPPARVVAGVDVAPRRLDVARRRGFDGSEFALAPEHRAALDVFLTDLVRPYGLELRAEVIHGHSYGEMAAALIGDGDGAVDLIVLAFAVPDLRPGRATAAYLSHVCPGQPLAFALCDQGSAAAFSGLRLIREYARSGGRRHGLLLVAEQGALPYTPAAAVALPAAPTVCAVRCGDTGPARLDEVRQYPDVAPADASPLLADAVAELVADPTGATLILGGGLRWDGPAADRVRVAAADQPYTGVWWELAEELAAAPAAGRRVLLAEYETRLRYLSVCAVTMDG